MHYEMSAWNSSFDFGIITWIMVACQKQCVIDSMDAKIAAMAGHILLSYDWFTNIWLYWIYVGVKFVRYTQEYTNTHIPINYYKWDSNTV